MHKRHAQGSVAALRSAEEKHRGQAQRYRDDGLAEVTLVAVLVQGQPGSRLVAIHQARIGFETTEARFSRSQPCKPLDRNR